MESNSKFLSETELFDMVSRRQLPPEEDDNEEYLKLIENDETKANQTNSTNSTMFNASRNINGTNYKNISSNFTKSNNSLSNSTNSTFSSNKASTINQTNETIIFPCTNINTDKAIIKVEEIRNVDSSDIKSLQLYAENTNKLTNKFNSQLSWSRKNSDLSLEAIGKNIQNSKIFFSKMNLFERKILDKSKTRVKLTKENYKTLHKLFLALDKTSEYKINYKNIKDLWTTFNNKNSKFFPSNVYCILKIVESS